MARGPALPATESEDKLEARLPFHELVALRAQRWGDRVAVRSEQRSLTYRELVEAFHAVGEGLQRQGVVGGELVLVGSGDDPCDTLTLILGVMAAGAAYVPLDSASPAARQQAVQRDCGARWLLVAAGFDDRWRPPGLRVLPFDPGRPGWEGTPPVTAAMPPSRLPLSALDRPAYLMYTSGSTGTPKGVLISQRNLVHQCRARLQRYDDAPGILLGTYSFAFDSSLAGISHVLCAGGTLRFAGERLRRDPAGLRQLIADEGITHLDMVPSAYAAVLAEASAEQLRSLRVVVCGGEALPAERGRAALPAGPAGAAVQRIRPHRGHGVRDRARAGGGRAGTALDRAAGGRHQLLGAGFPGAAGAAGARGRAVHRWRRRGPGYHGRPAENARAFVQRRPGGGAEQRLYRTGDQVRVRGDGSLDMVGRRDDQVQLRGHRVELGEVEAVLRQVAGVKDAAVVLRSDPDTAPQLVGYYVAADAGAASAASIRKQLSARLPSYMVPAVLVPVPALRRTARGKLDRDVPAASPGRAASAAVHEPAGTATEVCLAGLWQRLLGKERIGRSDDFFALGGHSLLAVKLVDAIEREMGGQAAAGGHLPEPDPGGDGGGAGSHEGRDGPRWRCLEVIHGEGQGLPLFFLGSTAQARSIAAHLGDERPVYGLNIFGLHETGQDPPRLEIDRSWPGSTWRRSAPCGRTGRIAWRATARTPRWRWRSAGSCRPPANRWLPAADRRRLVPASAPARF